jgi:hypothetical protein
MYESKQDVLSTDVVVVEHASLFLGQDNNTAGSVCKALKHWRTPSYAIR